MSLDTQDRCGSGRRKGARSRVVARRRVAYKWMRHRWSCYNIRPCGKFWGICGVRKLKFCSTVYRKKRRLNNTNLKNSKITTRLPRDHRSTFSTSKTSKVGILGRCGNCEQWGDRTDVRGYRAGCKEAAGCRKAPAEIVRQSSERVPAISRQKHSLTIGQARHLPLWQSWSHVCTSQDNFLPQICKQMCSFCVQHISRHLCVWQFFFLPQGLSQRYGLASVKKKDKIPFILEKIECGKGICMLNLTDSPLTLPQHADCKTKPEIDPIRHRRQCQLLRAGGHSFIKAEVNMDVTCQPWRHIGICCVQRPIYYISVGFTVVAKGHRSRRWGLRTSSRRKTVQGIIQKKKLKHQIFRSENNNTTLKSSVPQRTCLLLDPQTQNFSTIFGQGGQGPGWHNKGQGCGQPVIDSRDRLHILPQEWGVRNDEAPLF
uniref:Uncharacterized protein n=1 Tax=Romanomermis culicivorax TaxID=13658 RepID=A0A915IBI9_ROMCU